MFSSSSPFSLFERLCMRGSTGCEVQPLDDDEAPGDLILLEGGAHWSCRGGDKATFRRSSRGFTRLTQPLRCPLGAAQGRYRVDS